MPQCDAAACTWAPSAPLPQPSRSKGGGRRRWRWRRRQLQRPELQGTPWRVWRCPCPCPCPRPWNQEETTATLLDGADADATRPRAPTAALRPVPPRSHPTGRAGHRRHRPPWQRLWQWQNRQWAREAPTGSDASGWRRQGCWPLPSYRPPRVRAAQRAPSPVRTLRRGRVRCLPRPLREAVGGLAGPRPLARGSVRLPLARQLREGLRLVLRVPSTAAQMAGLVLSAPPTRCQCQCRCAWVERQPWRADRAARRTAWLA
mmetsp:Transcript_31110/g.81526  ORF Transcript_31110/g.81526 Transcript_31110/m.81526 type:complete len:260 (-) Transcript_31110:470-1249(-)